MAAKPKHPVEGTFRAKSERATRPNLARPLNQGQGPRQGAAPVSFATSQPTPKVQKAQVPPLQARPGVVKGPAVQNRPQLRAQRQPLNGTQAARPLQAGLPVARQAAGVSQPHPVPAASQVSELVQTIQSPMGPLQIVTKQVNGKMVQLIRFNRPEPKGPSTVKKLVLAAIPGFFGIMGLSQLYQGKRMKGAAFLVGGLLASFISSWYLIIPARIEGLFTHGAILPPYALSFLSSLAVNPSLASKLSVDLMGVVAVVWALQLFDAMGPFFTKQSMVSVASSGQGPRVPLPLPSPSVRRAITPAPGQTFKAPEIKARA